MVIFQHLRQNFNTKLIFGAITSSTVSSESALQISRKHFFGGLLQLQLLYVIS
jgi:hypothetical protein